MQSAGGPDTPLLVATRSAHKLAEIRRILPELALESLADAGIPERAEEEALEVHDTFLANALAKARYFAARTGRMVLADDSGLRVEALGGRPGVRTKRFALDEGVPVTGGVDAANNATLLRVLEGVPPERRAARYVCAAASGGPGAAWRVALGSCAGRIACAERGGRGFGYDPLFLLRDGRTMAELTDREKDAISHRGAACRALLGTG